jgi:hypothetical protein
MTELAWKILTILIKARYTTSSPYRAEWHINNELGIEISQWSWKYPQTPVDHAVHTLIEKGLIEELPDLHCRYQIIEKEES